MSGEMKRIVARPLTRANFAEFGEVIDTNCDTHYPINAGKCERYHALAQCDVTGPDACLSAFAEMVAGRVAPERLLMLSLNAPAA